MKVRGFQVAPAELEGCILDHPDVNGALRQFLVRVGVEPQSSSLQMLVLLVFLTITVGFLPLSPPPPNCDLVCAGGEVPLAFVVLKTEAAQRAISSIEESAKVKASIQKVISYHNSINQCADRSFHSTFPTIRSITSD